MAVTENHYDAYARMIIAFAMPHIQQLLLKESEQASSAGFPNIVMQAQIDAAFLNPLNHFIKLNMGIGAEALKQLNAVAFQVLPYCNEVDVLIEQIAQQLKIQASSASPETVKNAQAKLKKHSEKVAELFGQAKQLEKQGQELWEQSSKLALEQHGEWEEYRQEYCKQLCEALAENGVPLNDTEKEAILRNDSIVEIIRQYENLNLPLPIAKEKLATQASNFFRLLAWFAIHASLSRRLESHTPDDVNKLLE